MRIGLIQGNGSDLVGGGSIQKEYDVWSQQESDIEIEHLVFTENTEVNFYKEKVYHGRLLHNVREFNLHNLDLSSYDKVIVLTFPFLDKYQHIEKELYETYKKAFVEFNGFIGIICYDYLKEVVLNNLGAKYTGLYQFATKIWVNNEKNPLIQHLLAHNIEYERFHIRNPQFMVDHKEYWLSHNDKLLTQIYFQGRSLDWKGYKEVITLKEQLRRTAKDVNVTLNGITENVESENTVQYRDFDALKKFKTSIQDRTEVYGQFSPDSINKLTQKAGFYIYYTILEAKHNFFPEYALIDAIRNGTPVILPEYYKEEILEDFTHKNHFLFWNDKDFDSTQELSNLLTRLQYNGTLYDEYRNNAYNYMVNYHGANKKIREFIGE